MRYLELDTPSLLIDRERLMKNLNEMQSYADAHGAALRPHTKTHKCPEIAKLQLETGACGIAVAKTGEAEAMAENGISDCPPQAGGSDSSKGGVPHGGNV